MTDISNERMCGSVSVLDFGAVGDGVADDHPAIAAALASGAAHVIIPAGTFVVSNVLRPQHGQTVEIHGTLRSRDGVSARMRRDVNPDDNRVEVEDGSIFRVGDWVTIHDDDLPIQGGGRKVRRERAGNARISAIDGNWLQLDNKAVAKFSVAANGVVATQHSVILIEHSNVRICGTGVIDCNGANQLNAATGSLDRSYGEDWRANCGISVHCGEGMLTGIIIEGVTVRNAVMHNIALRGMERSVVRNTVCLGAHDKNITLRRCRDCLIIDNVAAESLWEDGIIFHQVADLEQSSQRVAVRGNLCIGNARNGISVGANMREIFLADNLCIDNGINLQISGDDCTSTGDVASGSNGRLFPLDAPRPSVLVRGRNISLRNFTSLKAVSTAVELCGQAITLSGGLIGKMAAPHSESDGVGIAVTSAIRSKQKVIPESIAVEGVDVRGCRLALDIHPEAIDVAFRSNRFADNGAIIENKDAVSPQVEFSSNSGLKTTNSGLCEIAAGADSIEVNHGLSLTPTPASITLLPLNRLAAASNFWIETVDATSFRVAVASSPTSEPARFAWRVQF